MDHRRIARDVVVRRRGGGRGPNGDRVQGAGNRALADAKSFAATGSWASDATVTSSTMVPAWSGAVTFTSTVSTPPEERSPRSHTTRPDDSSHEPWLGVADTNPTPFGSAFVARTFAA